MPAPLKKTMTAVGVSVVVAGYGISFFAKRTTEEPQKEILKIENTTQTGQCLTK